MTGGHKAIRLPPLKTLRVHNPKRQPENPCIAIMSSVLGMFSSSPVSMIGIGAFIPIINLAVQLPVAVSTKLLNLTIL